MGGMHGYDFAKLGLFVNKIDEWGRPENYEFTGLMRRTRSSTSRRDVPLGLLTTMDAQCPKVWLRATNQRLQSNRVADTLVSCR